MKPGIKWKVIRRAPLEFALAMWHLFIYWIEGKPVIAPSRIVSHRRSKCEACPHDYRGFCDLCSCYIDAKTMLSFESCPDTPKRWRALTSEVKDDTSGP